MGAGSSTANDFSLADIQGSTDAQLASAMKQVPDEAWARLVAARTATDDEAEQEQAVEGYS